VTTLTRCEEDLDSYDVLECPAQGLPCRIVREPLVPVIRKRREDTQDLRAQQDPEQGGEQRLGQVRVLNDLQVTLVVSKRVDQGHGAHARVEAEDEHEGPEAEAGHPDGVDAAQRRLALLDKEA
jgi:hypothetical protein